MLAALMLALCLWRGGPARAHGGVDDEKPEPAPAAAASTSSATETDLELHLEDLSQSAAGTSAPLAGAKVRGFLKHGDGDLLSRVTVVPERAPGYYLVRFGEETRYRFAEPGQYLLELYVQPARGDAFDTTVKFELPKVAPPTPPLWRRAWPIALGALLLLALLLLLRGRRSRRGKPNQAQAQGSVAAVLFWLALVAASWQAAGVRAHGGVDDERPEPAAAGAAASAEPASAEPASAEPASGIQTGQSSTTVRAGSVRITLIARTRAAAPQVLAPGEVQIPEQTAALLSIKTSPVQVAQLATGISFSGQIAADPNGLVRVASIVPGRVTRLAVAQGDSVRQGQVVAIVESRAVGEAQSAYQQALARFNNARSGLGVVGQQARAGVFSRAPLEVAQRARAEGAGDARQAQAAVQQAQVALDNATRLARVGAFAEPALEAARNAQAQAREAGRAAQAALANALASVQSAQAELSRRQQGAKAGLYVSRPVQEAQRALVQAQSARAAAQSEVAATRANLSRAKVLAGEGLVSQRDLEAAQQAFDTASARLETAQADERAAQAELARQQQLGATNVAGVAEVQAAQAALASAQADVRTRQAEVQRAQSQLQVSGVALSRERAIFGQNIANRREIEAARANLQAAQAAQFKARGTLAVTEAALGREQLVFKRNLNNTVQIQAARANFKLAQADLSAAASTLSLLKSAPGASVSVPVRAPLAGVVQARDVAVGELIQADAPLLTIVNLQRVALEAALFEADFARVRLGSPVRVTTDAMPGRSFSGRISFLGAQVSPQTRTIAARAVIENPGGLRPGMFARGQIQTGVSQPSLTVPDSAVLEDGAAQVVFVAQEGKYQRREISTGSRSNGRVEVKSGLKAGEEVVSEGAAALRAQAARGS